MSTPPDPSRLPRRARSDVMTPTRWTVFLRTFAPWQLWRFAVINLKMLSLIRRSHRTHTGGR